ncbi:MAG: DUF4845 domain-containing protein [Halieaceae bacterium]
MSSRNRQSGMSLLGILIVMGLLSFFLMVSIRLIPTYMEGRSVKSALELVAEGATSKQSLSEITKRIATTFNTNRIEAIKPREVKVYRDKGKIVIDANYETRTPLFDGVDAVLMFTDNIIVID